MEYPLIAYCCYEGVYILYDIISNGEQIGYVNVEKEGLYYKFVCKCTFHDQNVHRVVVSDGESVLKLGICVPDGDKFTLLSRVPVKYLKGKNLRFWVESNCSSCIPVSSGKPFAQLDKLETARLQITNGQPSIIID